MCALVHDTWAWAALERSSASPRRARHRGAHRRAPRGLRGLLRKSATLYVAWMRYIIFEPRVKYNTHVMLGAHQNSAKTQASWAGAARAPDRPHRSSAPRHAMVGMALPPPAILPPTGPSLSNMAQRGRRWRRENGANCDVCARVAALAMTAKSEPPPREVVKAEDALIPHAGARDDRGNKVSLARF